MDAMDILGALLGKKAGAGSSGGAVLKDVLAGGRSGAASQSPPRQHPRSRQPRTIDEAASSLEEMLGVGRRAPSQNAPSHSPTPSPQSPSRPSQSAPTWTSAPTKAVDEQSKLLIRAMVKAAKSDGQITRDEQDRILKQLDNVTQEEINFLKATFDEPLDVRSFTWDVPLGLEEQVYTVSLISIDLNEQKEADYLADLAHGLRLDPARCNQIHQNYGAPVIFKT